MQNETWPELSAHLYRRVAQECAREQRRPAAAVIYTGVCAEYIRRWEIGATAAATPGGAHLEVLHGDPLALKASEELGTYLCGSLVEWVAANWVFVRERVDTLLQMPEIPGGVSAVDAQTERRHRVAAMQSIAVASDSTTAALAWAAAVAVARVRLGERWYGLSADERDAHLAEGVCGDPVWAAAGEELDEQHRRGAERWVHERWDELTAVVEELAALTKAATAPLRTDQRADIAKHEVKVWLTPFGVSEPAITYAAGAAEGMAYWEDCSRDPEEVDGYMDTYATMRTPGDDGLDDVIRVQCREMVRDRWAQLAPPPRAH